MNFVIDLLKNKSCDTILIMINRLIKMRHYIICRAEDKETSAEQTV